MRALPPASAKDNAKTEGTQMDAGEPWKQKDKFYVSPHNFSEEVRAEVRANPALELKDRIYDSTIRKLLLTPGLALTTVDMMHVVDALADLGMRHLVTNIHWWGEDFADPLEWSIATGLLTGGYDFEAHITLDNVWADDWEKWVERLAGMGMRDVTYFFTPPRVDSGKRAPTAMYERITHLVSRTAALGLKPSLMLGDVARVHFEDLVALSRCAIDAGMVRLGVADSVSCLSHRAMTHFLARLRAGIDSDVPFLVHTHDDLGLATATAVDVLAGGDLVEVSLNGLSDRAGFPALEEVVVIMESMYGMDTGLDLRRLLPACKIAEKVGMPVQAHKAVSGRHAFMLDLPYAVEPTLGRGRYQFPPAWTCIDPRWVGGQFDLKWLRQFLAAPILKAKLRSLDLPVDEESVRRVRRALLDRLDSKEAYPVWLDEDEVDALCRYVLS